MLIGGFDEVKLHHVEHVWFSKRCRTDVQSEMNKGVTGKREKPKTQLESQSETMDFRNVKLHKECDTHKTH